MRRSRTLQLTIAVAFLTTLGPLLAAVYLSQQQGLRLEFERVTNYVNDVIYRSDRTVSQMQAALVELGRTNALEPCSDALVDRMQQISLTADYVEIIGHVVGTQMDCSSLGWHDPVIELGAPDRVTNTGSLLRQDLDLSIQSNLPFLGLERGGYIAIANRAQALDLTVEQEGVLFATFAPDSGVIRTANGEIKPEWVRALGDNTITTFVDDDYIVGVGRSSQITLTAAIAAVPTEILNQRTLEFIAFLLPIGLFTSIGLTALVIHLARQRMSLPNELKMGLKRNEFFLAYQPIVDLQSGYCVGAEALLRWRRRNGSITYPDAFIQGAESAGLVEQLTQRVIELAKKDMPLLMQENPLFRLSINLSADDLFSKNIVQRLLEIPGSTSGRLTVEITERVMLDPERACQCVQAIRDSGISVALDDFGTGYSSLSYLETMRFDCMKIDRLFVEAIDTEAATNRVVLHIIEMAKTLRLELVAEGVETKAQADFLRALGVHYAQGWLFGKPVTAEHFSAKTANLSPAFAPDLLSS